LSTFSLRLTFVAPIENQPPYMIYTYIIVGNNYQ
jgi:hypothetical protein